MSPGGRRRVRNRVIALDTQWVRTDARFASAGLWMNHHAKSGWTGRIGNGICGLCLILFALPGVLIAAVEGSATSEIGQAYQEGPLGTRIADPGFVLPTGAEEAIAFVALVAIVIGFRASGLSQSGISRRRTPPVNAR